MNIPRFPYESGSYLKRIPKMDPVTDHLRIWMGITMSSRRVLHHTLPAFPGALRYSLGQNTSLGSSLDHIHCLTASKGTKAT